MQPACRARVARWCNWPKSICLFFSEADADPEHQDQRRRNQGLFPPQPVRYRLHFFKMILCHLPLMTTPASWRLCCSRSSGCGSFHLLRELGWGMGRVWLWWWFSIVGLLKVRFLLIAVVHQHEAGTSLPKLVK